VDYHDSEGLLKSIRYPNGDFRLYDYDKNGHVLEVSTDTGKSISLKAKPCLDLTKNSQCVEVFSGGDLMQKILVDQSGTVVFHEQKGNPCTSSVSSGQQEWTYSGLSCSHLRLRASTAHPSLMTTLPSSTSTTDQSQAPLLNFGKPTSQWLTLGAPFSYSSSSDVSATNSSNTTSNLLTWTYKSDGSTQLSKQLQFGSLSGSSGNQLFGAHYDAVSDEEVFYNGQGQRLFSVKYKSGLLPTQWSLSGLEPN
jgi:hypothetical protein